MCIKRRSEAEFYSYGINYQFDKSTKFALYFMIPIWRTWKKYSQYDMQQDKDIIARKIYRYGIGIRWSRTTGRIIFKSDFWSVPEKGE